jgi:hypothetical protein
MGSLLRIREAVAARRGAGGRARHDGSLVAVSDVRRAFAKEGIRLEPGVLSDDLARRLGERPGVEGVALLPVSPRTRVAVLVLPDAAPEPAWWADEPPARAATLALANVRVRADGHCRPAVERALARLEALTATP